VRITFHVDEVRKVDLTVYVIRRTVYSSGVLVCGGELPWWWWWPQTKHVGM